MELLELKERIIKNNIPRFMIFVGDEIAVRNLYLEKIKKTLNMQVKRVDNVSSIYSKLTNTTLDKSYYIYVITDDKDIQSQEKLWSTLQQQKITGNNYVILNYNTIDKRNKFYKQNQDIIVEFEKLSEDILIKYIQKDLSLNNFNCKRLIECTSYNYMSILLELDKVKRVVSKLKLSADEAFEYCWKNSLIHMEIQQDVFDFINSVADRNPKAVISKLQKLKKLQEPDIKIISLLYNLFRNMFIVLSAGNYQGICERTGLTSFQIKMVREHLGKYDKDECGDIMAFIKSIEQKYKTGGIEQSISIDYIITQIL